MHSSSTHITRLRPLAALSPNNSPNRGEVYPEIIGELPVGISASRVCRNDRAIPVRRAFLDCSRSDGGWGGVVRGVCLNCTRLRGYDESVIVLA